ncbi:hypothetical protein Tco_0347824 [Tanacetum coccineum]
MRVEKRVWELRLMKWLDQGYGGSLVGNEGNVRFEDEDEEDEDYDEIKGLIWVYNHIANKREKSGHM